ncbi:MAG: thioredoxin domain-containing protein [Anaerolineae bacterium]|jgi:hypothetical protein|nr:thioredoxin domain-containing protein [Anaerolineae bacterium]
MFRVWLVVMLLSLTLSATQAQAIDPYVNDFAGVLLEPFEANLRVQFAALADSQDLQLTLATLNERHESPEQLFEEWEIGQGFSAGVLVVIYTEERESAIVSTLATDAEQEITQLIDTALDSVTVSSTYSFQLYRGFSDVIVLFNTGISLDQQPAGPYAGIPMWRSSDGAFSLGDPAAPITIVLFTDFACPHCQQFREDITRPLIDEYVREGLAIFEYRTYATAGGDSTVHAGQLMECASEQRAEAAWEAFDYFFEIGSTRAYDTDMTDDLATELDLDADLLVACLPTAFQAFDDYDYGVSLGVFSTPSPYARLAGGLTVSLDRDWEAIVYAIEVAND